VVNLLQNGNKTANINVKNFHSSFRMTPLKQQILLILFIIEKYDITIAAIDISAI